MYPKIGIWGPTRVGKTTLIIEAIKNKIPTWTRLGSDLIRLNEVLITSQKNYLKMEPLEMEHRSWEDTFNYFFKINQSFIYEGNFLKKYLQTEPTDYYEVHPPSSKNVLLLPPKDVYESRYLLGNVNHWGNTNNGKPNMEQSYSKYKQLNKIYKFDLVIKENLSPKDLLDFIINKFELRI
tara:strand:- start:2570 stop:3109 length:540 start_codon:yes stop_codon:yes gene_type:complete